MDVRLTQLESLAWLWLVAVAVAALAWGWWRGEVARRAFASHPLFPRLAPRASRGRALARGVLTVLAMVALVAALLDPRWGRMDQPLRRQGIDVMVVVDVSKSMLARDATPTRLERTRRCINDLVDAMGGDRVGLVAFAGSAAVQCPLTIDYGAFRLALEALDTTSVPRGGSRLGDALLVAADAFADEEPDHKAIIVFSDGEDHDSAPEEAARVIGERGIPIHTVGLGDATTGARIPAGEGLFVTHEGQQVWSRLDADGLRAVAVTSGGVYLPVGTGTADFRALYDELIEPSARREFDAVSAPRHEARYQWFAGLALLLLTIEALIGSAAPRRMEDPA